MNDELDEILYNKLSQEREIPEKISNELNDIIYRSIYNDKKIKITRNYSISKIIAIACAMIITTTGIVYAGKVIYERIWENPEKTMGFYSEEKAVKEDEKENSISESEARKKAEEILQNFDCNDEKIKTIKLENNPSDYELDWCITTDNNTKIRFDAKGEAKLKIFFNSILEKNINKYRTNKNNAEKTARELCKYYGYNLDGYNKIEIYNNLNSEEESYIWYVDFYKEYDGITNLYEYISIGFVPEINQIYYFKVSNLKYENNPIEVTEEQAKQIVMETENEIKTNHKIKEINAKLDIAKMNGDAYLRTTDYEQYYKQLFQDYPSKNYIEYRTNNHVRKVWKVTITYDVDHFNSSYDLFIRKYTYFVDSTTGEIIGGSLSDY